MSGLGFAVRDCPRALMGLKMEATWSPRAGPELNMKSKWSQIGARSPCDMLKIGTPSRRETNFAINLCCSLQRVRGRLSGRFGFVLGYVSRGLPRMC